MIYGHSSITSLGLPDEVIKIYAQKYLTGSRGDKSPIYFYFTVYFGICQGLEEINSPFVIIIP